jgi:hypothetical protein
MVGKARLNCWLCNFQEYSLGDGLEFFSLVYFHVVIRIFHISIWLFLLPHLTGLSSFQDIDQAQ